MNMKMQFVQRNHLKKKCYKQFLVKNEIVAAGIFLTLDLFFNFNFFHVILVILLDITSANKNKNMHIFYKSCPKLNYIHFLKISSNFTIFPCKLSVIFESRQDIR